MLLFLLFLQQYQNDIILIINKTLNIMESKEFNKEMTSANNGFIHLLINLILLIFSIWLVFRLSKLDLITDPDGSVNSWVLLPVLTGFLLFIAYILHLIGFMTVQPNESRVLTFFGKYSGTVKQNGFSGSTHYTARKSCL